LEELLYEHLLVAGAANVAGKTSSGIKHDHKFGWRDMYDISVRWRQISEPNDPVWWVDQLTPEQFSEGFGSHTPIITGQCNVVRYGPMFPVRSYTTPMPATSMMTFFFLFQFCVESARYHEAIDARTMRVDRCCYGED
jgi:hypothetical protein